MSTDGFTEAARAEAERRWPRVARRNKTAEEWLDEGMASGFVLGAQWSAAQEPTDAEAWENEVAAALPERYDGEEDQRDIILRAVKDMAARETQEPTDAEVLAALEAFDGFNVATWGTATMAPRDSLDQHAPLHVDRMRAALSAARAARRDKEKRDG